MHLLPGDNSVRVKQHDASQLFRLYCERATRPRPHARYMLIDDSFAGEHFR
jgi:hypothetical protein